MIPLNLKTKPKNRKASTTVDLYKVNSNDNSKQTIDIFLSKHMDNPYYKYLMFTFILIFMSDGAEMVIIAMSIDSIAIEFNLYVHQKSMLPSIVFIGLFIGPIISTKINDKFGRKNLIIVGAIVIVIFGILSGLASSFNWLVLLRFLMGIGIGTVIPSATSLISESVPIDSRSFYLNNVWVAAPLAEIYVYLLSYGFSLNTQPKNWRYMMFLGSLPSLISIFLLFNIKESIRYLLMKNEFDKGFKILDELGQSKGIKLTEIEKTLIKTEINDINDKQNLHETGFKMLLSDYLKDTSIKLWIITFMNSFIIYGGMFIFPQILKFIKKTDEYSHEINVYLDLIITSLIYMPTTFIAGYLSEIPFLGRKKSLALGFFISSITCLYCMFIYHVSYLSYSMIRLGVGISYSVLGVYTSEVYPTKIRTVGNSSINAVSRISGFLSPLVMEILFDKIGYDSPIFLFFIFSMIGGLLCLSLLVDTYKKSLDFSLKSSIKMNLL